MEIYLKGDSQGNNSSEVRGGFQGTGEGLNEPSLMSIVISLFFYFVFLTQGECMWRVVCGGEMNVGDTNPHFYWKG